MALAKNSHLHFLGIFGHARRGVAAAAKEMGYQVTGTDDGDSPPVDFLAQQGISWWSQPDAAHLDGVDQVIISGHTQPDHPEVVAAKEQAIPIVSFAQFVGEQTSGARTIVVAGTHGKTTTTSLITWIFECAGKHPDYLIGIKPHNFERSVRLTGSDWAVLEGDEYRAWQLDDRSKFEFYHPDILVVTNVEMDHPDFFADFAAIRDKFVGLAQAVRPGGRFLYNHDCPAEVFKAAGHGREYYDADTASRRGLDSPYWTVKKELEFTPDGLRLILVDQGTPLGTVEVPLYGVHNVQNTVAACGVALGEGIAFTDVKAALASFKGASRRFERVSPAGAAVTVIDDYAHHPTEVAATIAAAKQHFPGRVIVFYQPHTYSRTKELLKEYHQAFRQADAAFLAEIESAREAAKERTVSSADIAAGAGEQVAFVADRGELIDRLVAAAQPGDTILCMSVGGNEQLAQEVAGRTS